MKAYTIKSYSKKEKLKVVEISIPEPKADEVLVDLCN
jgi:NADPH:quinone reductase-like Zn-dependent oxidoreductase